MGAVPSTSVAGTTVLSADDLEFQELRGEGAGVGGFKA